MKQKDIKKLIKWNTENKRDLPWRHTKDPYKIWISEVMLQQTRAETVINYYTAFIKELPTIKDLAKVSEDKLLKLWEGLGYYSRARNLKKCAQEVIKLGLTNLPQEEEELKKLPGIGPYTAGAILSIAYQKQVPAIDGNVMRVLARVYEEKQSILENKVRKSYEETLQSLMPKNETRKFTEGFIELGAKVCLPKKIPLCGQCPLQECCQAYIHNKVLEYPVKKVKTKRKIEEKTVLIFAYHKTYAIAKRKESLLNGLYGFPNYSYKMSLEEITETLKEQNINGIIIPLEETKHIFSHIEWHMTNYLIELQEPPIKGHFYSKEEILSKYSLPTAFRKIFIKIPEYDNI